MISIANLAISKTIFFFCFLGLIKVLLYVLFVLIMVRVYTLPLFALRPTYLAMR